MIDVIAEGSSSQAVLDAARKIATQRAENAKGGVWGLIKVGGLGLNMNDVNGVLILRSCFF